MSEKLGIIVLFIMGLLLGILVGWFEE